MSKTSTLQFLLINVIAITCSDVEEHQNKFKMLATLSRYDAMRGDSTFLDCNPLRFWILHRHGSRHPSTTEIKDIGFLLQLRDAVILNHASGYGTLTRKELEHLKNWKFDRRISSVPLYLTESGFNETKSTAERFTKRLGTLLKKPYNKRNYYFQHSDTQRTQQTCDAFIDGIFGKGAHETVTKQVCPLDNDKLLYPFGGACQKLTKIISNHTYIFNEANAFTESPPFLSALRAISTRLGFKSILPRINLIAIFGACAYDVAWSSNSVATWCAALGDDGRLIGEYFWDLAFQYYTLSGNERAGCELVTDLWERFATATGELKIKNKREYTTALFTHDVQLLLFYSTLGLLPGYPPLTADNFANHPNRVFRTSRLTPFAANAVAILYKCESGYEVLLKRNENRWTGIPGCRNGVCKWNRFKEFIKPVADKCNFEEFC